MCADGKRPVVPEGCGAARIPENNAEGHVPTKCCHAPDIPNFTLSPNSFKPLLGKHCDGCTLNCDDGKKTFHFSVNHKKRNACDGRHSRDVFGCCRQSTDLDGQGSPKELTSA